MNSGLLQANSTLWLVCGAGRGVGKTRLAESLCRVLPGSIYAKQGTGGRRAEKAENFFHSDPEIDAFIEQAASRHRHLVIESNALVKRGRGDIIVFLEARPRRSSPHPGESDGTVTQRGPRPDAAELRRRATIDLAGPARPRAWARLLARTGLDAETAVAVIAVLRSQNAWGRNEGNTLSLASCRGETGAR